LTNLIAVIFLSFDSSSNDISLICLLSLFNFLMIPLLTYI